MGSRTRSQGGGDRAATEQALEEAALDLIEREGVLAGLNLQQVADHAGVNRGLVYHYFGSRRDLLRRALRRYALDWMSGVEDYHSRPLPERAGRLFRAMVRYPRTARLILLLAVDGDRAFRMPGDHAATLAAYQRDVEAGVLAAGLDVDALSTVLLAAVFAYAVRRTVFAREQGVAVRDLDRRVEEMLVRMVSGLAPDRPPRGGPGQAARHGATVETFYRLMNERRFAEMWEMFTPDAVWGGGGTPTPHPRPIDEMRQVIVDPMPVFVGGGIRFTLHAVTAEGDRVAAEVESYAELTNGRVYNNQYHMLFEFRGGRIRSVKEYCDTHHAREVFS